MPETESAAPAIESVAVANHEEAPASAIASIPQVPEPVHVEPSGPALMEGADNRPPAQPIQPAYRERVGRGEKKARQLSLF